LEMRQRIMLLHAEQALNSMDLQLARTIALSLPDSDRKGALLQEVVKVEVERSKLHDATRQKRTYLVLSVILVFLAVVLVGLKTINDVGNQAKLMETEAERRREAQRLE